MIPNNCFSKMKLFDYYQISSIEVPRKSDFISYYAYNKGEVLYRGSGKETSKSQLVEKFPGCIIQECLDNDSYGEALLAHRKDCIRLRNEFKEDLFVEFSVTNNPKRFKCYDLAANRGSNLEEIYDIFEELVDLIR